MKQGENLFRDKLVLELYDGCRGGGEREGEEEGSGVHHKVWERCCKQMKQGEHLFRDKGVMELYKG